MTNKNVLSMVLWTAGVALLGAAGGAEYVMRRVDEMDAVAQVQREDAQKKSAESIRLAEQSAQIFAQANAACRQQFTESTVIYERAPQLTLSLGFRGLPVIPIGGQGDEAPHWVIPAKIKPVVLGDARGAVYYYMSAENRMDGPYLPEVAK